MPPAAPPRDIPAPPALQPDDRKLRTEAAPAGGGDGSEATAEAPPAAVHGPVAIRLSAAVESHDAAQAEWKRLSHAHPALFGPALGDGKAFEVLRADHDGRAIYRLRLSGFDSQAAAAAFCRQAHDQDVACTVADF